FRGERGPPGLVLRLVEITVEVRLAQTVELALDPSPFRICPTRAALTGSPCRGESCLFGGRHCEAGEDVLDQRLDAGGNERRRRAAEPLLAAGALDATATSDRLP